MYIAPVQDIIMKYNLNCIFYADDTQLYIAIDPTKSTDATDQLRSFIQDVMQWNTTNMLMCNAEKTEVIIFSSRFNRGLLPTSTFSFGNTTIETSKSVKNLGVRMDNQLTFREQVNSMCKKAMFAIRSIGRIKKYLTRDNLAKLVNAFATPHLDYCNAILYKYQKQK